MAAYGVWDGVPDNASTPLLQKILRQEWGFDGFVISDCGALANFVEKQGIVQTMSKAAALGIRAGVSMNCGTTHRDWAAKALGQGLIKSKDPAILSSVILAMVFVGVVAALVPARCALAVDPMILLRDE